MHKQKSLYIIYIYMSSVRLKSLREINRDTYKTIDMEKWNIAIHFQKHKHFQILGSNLLSRMTELRLHLVFNSSIVLLSKETMLAS